MIVATTRPPAGAAPAHPTELSPADWAQIVTQLPIPVQEVKLTAGDASNDYRFGAAVAVEGDTVVVGAHGESGGPGDPLYHAGAAYIFERNLGGPNNWGQAKKLTASDPGFFDEFGQAVTISGDTIAVGAPYENGGDGNPMSDAGAVYIFERDQGGPGNWGEVVKLSASDPGVEDDFGRTISLHGDTLVVGAPGEDGGAGDPLSGAGAVYIFERDQGETGTWTEVIKLAAGDAESSDLFGLVVALHNDTLVVGAPQEDGGLGWAGAVYVFERDHGGVGSWGEVKKLSASDAGNGDRFGSAVAVDEDTIVIGAPFEDGGPGDPQFVAGAAYVFERNLGGANAWGESTKLAAPDPQEGDFFARHIAILKDTIVVGTPYESGGPGDPLLRAGTVFVFARDQGGVDNWELIAELMAEDAQAEDTLGDSVAINSAGAIVTGASGEDGGPGDPLPYAGAAYIFCVDDDLEENDDFAQATVSLPGSYPGLQVCGGDDDYYVVALAAGDTLEVDALFSHAAGNLDLALYDADQSLLAVSDSVTDDEHISYIVPEADDYLIRVYGFEGALNTYTLLLNVSGKTVEIPTYLPILLGE
jgi:hypothetical protein